MSRANLLVIQGVDQGTRFEVDQEHLRIGRGAQNDVRILDTEMSRHIRWYTHAGWTQTGIWHPTHY